MTLYSYLAFHRFVWKCFLLEIKRRKANWGPAGFIAGILNKHMWKIQKRSTVAHHLKTDYDVFLCFKRVQRIKTWEMTGVLHLFIRWKHGVEGGTTCIWLFMGDFTVNTSHLIAKPFLRLVIRHENVPLLLLCNHFLFPVVLFVSALGFPPNIYSASVFKMSTDNCQK